jgi:hypothetical protein
VPPIRGIAILLLLATTGCATRYDAACARFVEPDYIVTKHFYEEAPQRVAVLPFATRADKPVDSEKTELCRRVFYQHISLRDFEGLGLHRFDVSMLSTNQAKKENALKELVDVVRFLDIVGMTTVMDLSSLFKSEKIQYSDFTDMINTARDDMHADAYVVGMTRSYGRLYAVVLSSIGLSTRVEMRSSRTGQLLWRGEEKKRNYELPLTLNPLDIPRLLFDVWRNSRGLAMHSLAYEVYGDLCETVPYMPATRQVFVEASQDGTPYFDGPTMWLMFPNGRAKAGDRFAFDLERNGWYQCRAPDDRPVWIFRRCGRLVDQDGKPVDPHADMRW